MKLEDFVNNDFMQRYFEEEIDIIQDVQNFCSGMIGVNLAPETFNQLKNIDKNLLQIIAMAEQEIGYDSF